MQRNFVLGACCGGLLCLTAVAMSGMSPRPLGDNRHITQSADGRTAYLWEVRHDSLELITQSRATGSKGEGKDRDDDRNADHDHDEDEAHDHDDDAGAAGKGRDGKGKGKGKDRD